MQSKILKVLFWTAFWGGNLFVIGFIFFAWVVYGNVSKYIASLNYMDGLLWGGYMVIIELKIPILITNLLFFGHLIFIKKQHEKKIYQIITIVIASIVVGYVSLIMFK